MRWLLVKWWLLVAVLPGLALASSDVDPALQLARTEAAQALSTASSPRAAAHLVRLHALRDELSDLQTLADVYSQILSNGRADPFARDLARSFLADVERARGRLTKSAELVEPLGYIHDYYVLGAFDNEGKAGCSTDFGPEANLDLKTSYPAKGHPAVWRKINLRSFDDYIDLSAAIRPNREAVAYALTFLQASRETSVSLSLGTSGAFRLWVNGELAGSSDRYNAPRPDQTRLALRLRRGPNRVLLKICQNGGPFGFYLRHERLSGSASIVPILPDSLPALERGPRISAKSLPTLTTALERELNKRPNDAALRGEFASILAYSRSFDETERRDRAEAEQAADAARDDVTLQLIAAQLQEDEPNQRRRYLDSALRTDPSSAAARLCLAQLELARGHPEPALQVADQLIADYPNFAAPWLVAIRAHDMMGEWPKAAEMTETAFRNFPHRPQIAREAASASRRLDRLDEAISRIRVTLALRYDDMQARRLLAGLLSDLGRVDDAQRELELVLKFDPFDNSTRLRLAELFAANSDLENAKRLFVQAKFLSPDEPEVYEREGRALLQAGRREEALVAFERALSLRPQNPALKEIVRSMKGEKSSQGLQFKIPVAPLVREADSLVGEDAVYLVDYTYSRVQPSGLSSRFQQTAVKVYTQRGVEAFRSHPITYSPNRQDIQVLRARITKPDGSTIESHSERERSINEPWSGMYYDARARVLSFPALSVGDVLEFEYRVEDTAQDNLLSDYWGDVDYIQTTNPKIRYQYIVDMPAERPLYWNKSQAPAGLRMVQEKLDGRTLYRWTLAYVPKVVPEPSMPGWGEVVPTLHVSTYKTWEQVGRYYWGLVRDQLTPNDEIRKAVDKALVGVKRTDELQVIRAIYNFVVTSTRYVALEFGIHGYKPYRVDRVLARRFGDCKDKASLIYAMLKVAGIDSRLVLLRMRHLGAIGEDPASLAVFNHAITYVPKYDLFLDGTAEFHGARELPTADRNANILVVDPGGKSVFRKTPESSPEENSTRLSLEIALHPNGSGHVKGQSKVSGANAPEFRRAYQSTATRKSSFERSWSQTFPGLSVRQLTLSDPSKLDQDVTLEYQMDVPRFAEVVGESALRFQPFSGNSGSYTQAYAQLAERRFDLVLPQPSVNQYAAQYKLPTGYGVSDVPANVSEDSKFGRLRTTYRIENGILFCTAEVMVTVSRVKPEDYPAFRLFLGRVDQELSRKLISVNHSGQTAQK
jgi:tetratricopeptide (TPR) repeat protein